MISQYISSISTAGPVGPYLPKDSGKSVKVSFKKYMSDSSTIAFEGGGLCRQGRYRALPLGAEDGGRTFLQVN